MTYYQESIQLFRKFAPALKIFLIIYIIFCLILPIDELLSIKLQKTIVNGLFNHSNRNLSRLFTGIFFGYAYLINDPILLVLITYFAYHHRKND